MGQNILREVSTQVEFSETESRVLGLKIARCNTDYFNEDELYAQIVYDDYDLCRVKVASEDEFAASRLHNTGLPVFFSGSIRRYKTRIKQKPAGVYNYDNLVWELYDGSQDRLLKDMLVGTWGPYPIGYYRSPYLSGLVDKEIEIESVFQFYKKNNHPQNNPTNSIVFIRHGENYVGFFALNIHNGNLESHIGGILEPYRKGGYFLDKLRYIQEFCVNNNLEHFIFGARNENAEVQRIFQYVGFQPIGSENVFHVASLLNTTQRDPIIKELEFSKSSQEVYRQLFVEALAVANGILPQDTRVSFRVNHPEHIAAGKARIRFSFPVLTSDEILVVLKSPDYPLFTGFLGISRRG